MANQKGKCMANGHHKQLTSLPVEMLTEIYLAALSPAFPLVCSHVYHTIKSLPPFIHAQYLLARHPATNPQTVVGDQHLRASELSRILCYPICTLSVIKALCHLLSHSKKIGPSEKHASLLKLPRRFFRELDEKGRKPFSPDSEPLPFLRFLWNPSRSAHLPDPDPNSYNGYALVRAVHARFTMLIQFLLDGGANPSLNHCMAIRVAIGKRDLALVKMLIEFPPENTSDTKRRKRQDRVEVTQFMLKLAVRFDARDIVRYFMEEKSCVPDAMTLQFLHR